ncbi:MAG: hypothetical protein DMG91_13720 [Acidobacteria bacterium]|nr:MAG: hypothetical protein DMG91_13720 [Acidobacteriota bacterium]
MWAKYAFQIAQFPNCSISKSMSLRQLTIIGTGLIGGSFGLALKKRGFAGTIVGCDRGAILEHAQSIGAIDVARVNPVEAILGSQVVLLATPVGSIIEMIRNLEPAITGDVLLTDVGSTKLEIVAQARHIFGADYDHRFLPGHPIAGKEHSGIEFADPDLFQGALWYFTPDINREPTTLAREFAGLVGCVGAHIAAIDPAEHDRLCAWTSHLPQMLSTALAASLVEEFGSDARRLKANSTRHINSGTLKAFDGGRAFPPVSPPNSRNTLKSFCEQDYPQRGRSGKRRFRWRNHHGWRVRLVWHPRKSDTRPGTQGQQGSDYHQQQRRRGRLWHGAASCSGSDSQAHRHLRG